MLTENFYDILDSEIDAIINRYKDHPAISKHKDPNQKKAYGFLVWFLEFYGHVSQFKNYITNGSDDASCDIIFDRTDSHGKTAFYIVQAKWFTRKNAMGNISARDVKYSLNDFETIIRGDKQKSKNEKFNESRRSLLKHLKKNGEAKFIFLALAGGSDEYKDNVESFNKNNDPNCKVEIIDIERIKRDYIDLKYKGIKKETPLEIHVTPDYSKISLRIERSADVSGKGDIIKTSRPYRSYIVMVKPLVIYELFRTYGFLLFYRNVRNPLPESNFNAQIAATLKKQPDLFWYFNNGITAISMIIPEIGNEAREIEITGLQVINGAQTVYSIYRVYEEASSAEREIMDRDALIMLRLVDSSNEKINREITRYTNSQNPMVDRDFHANDDDQVRLQNASFDTIYWYEKRRGEFRQVPPGIHIIENLTLADAYLAFFMEDVHGAVLKNDLIFISRDIDPEGIYETIFTERVKFEDMLASYLAVEQILDFIHPNLVKKQEGMPISWDFHDVRFLLALAIAPLFKLVFKEYLSLKIDDDADRINLTHYILKNRPVRNVLENILIYVIHILKLFDGDGKINLKALEGKEALTQLVDIVYRKKTNEKLELRVDIHRMGAEFFEYDELDEFSDRLMNRVEKSFTPDEPKIKDPNIIKLMQDVLGLRIEEKYDTALLLFESIDRTEPGNWYIYKEWGVTYKMKGDFDNAGKKLQKAIDYAKSDKQKSDIYTELGDVYRANNMQYEALAAFEKAENHDRNNAGLYEKWAFLYYNMGKYHDAMNKMTMAVKLDENNEVYKWKFEFYSKKFTDKNFTVGFGKFLADKRDEKIRTRRPPSPNIRPQYTSYRPTPNSPANFDRFLKRHKPKEIVEGEILHIDPDYGIYVGFEFDISGLIFKNKLPNNFDVNDRFKVGNKIDVVLLFIKYDKLRIDLALAG